MSCRGLLLGTALGAAAVCITSIAGAQQQQPSKSTSTQPEAKDLAPGQSAPAPSPSPAATTQTTSAEYNEMVNAEVKEFRPNRRMIITGTALFLAPYLTGVVVAAQSDLEEDKRLYVPLVGPWLDLGQRPCAFGSSCDLGDYVASAFLVSSGVAQALGLILVASSFAYPERTRKGDDVVSKAKVQVVPVSFAAGGGLGAVGRF